MSEQLIRRRAFRAKIPLANRTLRVAFNGNEFALLVVYELTASDAAVRANRSRHLCIISPRVHGARFVRHRFQSRPVDSLANLTNKWPFQEQRSERWHGVYSSLKQPSSLLSFSSQRVKHKMEFDQRIERTTPPSARKAAPFVADESGVATNATNAATSSGVAKRCSSELGRAVVKNSFSTAAGVACLVLAKSVMNSSTPSERVGPARTEFTVTPVPAVVSASPRASATCIVLVTP